MADAKVVTVDSLSKEERETVCRALGLKLQSVKRAYQAEMNPAIREIRAKEMDAISALMFRLS